MKIRKIIDDKILPAIDFFTNQRYMKILTDSFMGVSALSIGAAIFTLIRSLPLGEGYINFLKTTGLYDVLNIPILITSDLIALYLVIALGYYTAKSFGKNTLSGIMVSLGAFLVLTPFETLFVQTSDTGEVIFSELVTGVIPTNAFGATGMFLAMLVGISATRLYIWCINRNVKIKMPDSVPENVGLMFEMMLPAGLVFLVFTLIRIGFSYTDFETAQQFIYQILQAPLSHIGGGFWGAFIYVTLPCVFWGLGLHGAMLVYVAMSPIVRPLWAENMQAFANGIPAPHPLWALEPYTKIVMLSLVLLMVFRANSNHFKTLGKLAFVPAIFNISEPIMYGVPIVMNVMLIIPYILTTALNFVLSILVINIGLVAPPTGALMNMMYPIGFMGALSNASWTGAVWQLVLVVFNMLIWYPFFKLVDNQSVEKEK